MTERRFKPARPYLKFGATMAERLHYDEDPETWTDLWSDVEDIDAFDHIQWNGWMATTTAFSPQEQHLLFAAALVSTEHEATFIRRATIERAARVLRDFRADLGRPIDVHFGD